MTKLFARDPEQDEQDKYDRTPICPRCESVCDSGLDYCTECGRKVKVDRIKGEASGGVEADVFLRRTFGQRLARFCEDAGLNNEETESLMEGQ